MNSALEFTRDELISEPEERHLNINKSIVVFNIQGGEKIKTLNTGSKFIYKNEIYEVMNREQVVSPKNYVKFNCVRKARVQAQTSG